MKAKKATLLEIWKVIRFDKFQIGVFTQALEADGFRVSDWAKDLMRQPDFRQSLVEADPEQEYELVVLTTTQLTGKDGGTTAEVFTGAEKLGLDKCPPWVSPMIRFNYGDQPLGEWLLIGMEPIADSGGRPRVFDVGRGGLGRWLDADYACPDNFWNADNRWVFVCRNCLCFYFRFNQRKLFLKAF